MKSEIKFALLSAALAAFTLPGFAQSADASAQGSASASTPVTGKTVQQRAENQQDRIAKGMKSGDLSAAEAARLEKNQAKINKEVRKDRAANGGKLTPQERAQVNRQLNRQSHQIARATHGGRH